MKLIYTLLAVMAGFFISALALAAEAGPENAIDFIGYLYSAWGELGITGKLVGTLWALVPVFSLIVSLTPTPRDDGIWGRWLYPIIEKLAMQFFKAKQKPGDNDLLKGWVK